MPEPVTRRVRTLDVEMLSRVAFWAQRAVKCYAAEERARVAYGNAKGVSATQSRLKSLREAEKQSSLSEFNYSQSLAEWIATTTGANPHETEVHSRD